MNWTDLFSPFLLGLLTALGIGLLVGLEREFNNQGKVTGHVAGLRTFPLLSVIGFLAGFLSLEHIPVLLPAMAAGVVLLVALAYYMQAREGHFGFTTEFAMVAVFLLGVLIAYDHLLDAVGAAVLMTTLLSLKEEFQSFTKRLTQQEIFAFIKFALLALLLLPMLPDEDFGPANLLNYRSIGWVVVLVSSLSFVGYLLLKFVQHRTGILLTALVGGMFSSTMIAWVFAARSKETPALARVYSAGILLASCILPLRVMLLSWIFGGGLSLSLLSLCGLILLVNLTAAWLVYRGDKGRAEAVDLPLGNPLDLRNALFFAVLYVSITLLLHYAKQWFGETGAYATGALAGLADMDAITISAAKSGEQGSAQAAIIVAIAALSNTLFKLTVAILRTEPAARRWMALGFGSVVLSISAWLAFQAMR